MVVNRSGIGRRPFPITALQTLVAGGLQVVLGIATGEAAHVVPQQLVAAAPVFVYLVVVCSLIGFPLLTWLLSQVSVQIANTAAYVAPVIALSLGWLLLAEQVTPRTLEGVGVILAGVALMAWSSRGVGGGVRAKRKAPAERQDTEASDSETERVCSISGRITAA